MQLGWQSWDRLCYILAYGSEEDLKDFVAYPADFIKHREDLPIAAHDAVPVYLDISTGKILVSTSVLDAICKRRLAKSKGLEPEELDEDAHLIAEGGSRGEKDRMTWLCRQGCYGYFKKGKPGQQAPRIKGVMLDSILFVNCDTFCQLENICRFTNTWLYDEDFWLNGRHVVRKAGDKVPAGLLKTWRQERDRSPELFEQGVLVWGSPNAYQNEVACSAHSKLLAREMPNGCLDLVDMFSGELTEHMESMNWLHNQVKAVIPPKQTAKAQVTDLHFSRIGKVAGNEAKRILRIAQKRAASNKGEAAKHESGPFECLTIVIAMHKRCSEDAAVGMVEQVFRKSGYLAFDFGEKGMTEAKGERWENLPLGGTNLPKKYLDLRFGHVDEKGVPQKPDWSRVHELRSLQRAGAKDDKEIKQKGHDAWLKASLTDKAKAAAAIEKEREEKEDRIMDEERKILWSEKDRCSAAGNRDKPE